MVQREASGRNVSAEICNVCSVKWRTPQYTFESVTCVVL